jgi:PDZ domain-containing protein
MTADAPPQEDLGTDEAAKRSRLTLSPRVRRFAVLALVAVLLVALASVLPVPYVRLSPGPTTNTLGSVGGMSLIEIEGRRTYPTEGNLNLTTVSVLGGPGQRLDLLSAVTGWLDGDVAVLPEESVYPADTTREQVQEQNAEEMQLSQENATVAALRELDIPVTTAVVIQAVTKDSPAVGKLKAADQILTVDGRRTPSPQAVRDAITAHAPGEAVRVEVERDGARRTETVTTTKAADGDQAVIGILPAVDFEFPFKVDIALEDVGGPSAGLMFALGIVDKLTPGAMTGGAFIAGTGTIDTEGRVGPIGGIQQKLAAARGAGATVFLTPADNCDEALGAVPAGLRLVRIAALDEAVDALDALRTGKGDIPSCAR